MDGGCSATNLLVDFLHSFKYMKKLICGFRLSSLKFQFVVFFCVPNVSVVELLNCFQEHVFCQKTLDKGFNNYWTCFTLNMSVTANFITSLCNAPFFSTVTRHICPHSIDFTLIYTTIVECILETDIEGTLCNRLFSNQVPSGRSKHRKLVPLSRK